MEAKHLHTRLGVRVIGGLEFELGDTNLLEEGTDHTNEIPQRQVTVRYQTLHLSNSDPSTDYHPFDKMHIRQGKGPCTKLTSMA